MWDVIVVGCGPAGTIAAYELARNSLRVLMLEKARLPRYKTCGGGLVQRTIDAIPFSIESAVEREIRSIRLSNNFRNPVLIERKEHFVRMTMRSTLDAYLTQKAVSAGAELKDGEAVREIIPSNDHIVCRTNLQSHEGSFVIGADGANSIVARSFGFPAPRCGVALEVEVDLEKGFEHHADLIQFDFNVLPKGYGWVFPKAEHLSCGVFSMHRNLPEIRKYYERYIRQKSFADAIRGASLSGHLIPLGPRTQCLNTSRAILTGDAAGLADPLTGEGISFAVRSGIVAARTLLESPNDLDRYSKEIAATMLPEIRISRLVANALYAAPTFLYERVVSKPFFTSSILNLFAGKTTYRELAMKAIKKPWRLGVLGG
jgi:geranylgeranyl reductase family protein